MKLRVGFIGVGAMGFSHLKTIHERYSATAEVAAYCSNSEDNIARARTLAPNATHFQNEEELIQSDLDAIFVSTPNFTHARLAQKVLACQRHLFLEKPIGISRTECAEVLAAAKQTDRVVMIGHELRYSPYFQLIKDLVAKGEIGRPKMAWCQEFRGPFQKKSRNWLQDPARSGGALLDKNCHHFDLMNWWVDSQPRNVCAFGAPLPGSIVAGQPGILDYATVNFDYASGATGTLQLCLFAPDLQGEDLRMGVIGDEGVLQTEISRLRILVWKRGQATANPIVHEVAAKRGEGWGRHLGHDEIHDAFIAAIQTGQPPLTSVTACLDGTLLGIAAEESVQRRTVVSVAAT